MIKAIILILSKIKDYLLHNNHQIIMSIVADVQLNVPIYRLILKKLLQDKDDKRAEIVYSKAVEFYPGSSILHREGISLAVRSKDWQVVLTRITRYAAALSEGEVVSKDIYRREIQALVALGRFEEANILFQKIWVQFPESAEILESGMIISFAAGQMQAVLELVAHYHTKIPFADTSVNVFLFEIRALLRLSRAAEAMDLFLLAQEKLFQSRNFAFEGIIAACACKSFDELMPFIVGLAYARASEDSLQDCLAKTVQVLEATSRNDEAEMFASAAIEEYSGSVRFNATFFTACVNISKRLSHWDKILNYTAVLREQYQNRQLPEELYHAELMALRCKGSFEQGAAVCREAVQMYPNAFKYQGPIEFEKIFLLPFSVKKYSGAQEWQSTFSSSSASEECSRAVSSLDFGEKPPKLSSVPGMDKEIPQLYVHELIDVPCYEDIFFSKDGGFFIDSARRYHPSRTGCGACFGPQQSRVGPFLIRRSDSFIFPQFPQSDRVVYYAEAATPLASFTGYGHVLLESLPRMSILKHGIKLKFIVPSAMRQLPQYLLDMVIPFGLSAEDFLFPAEFAVFKKLYLQSPPPLMLGGYVTSAAKDIFKTVSRYYSTQIKDDFPKRIYVRRKPPLYRRVLNEQDCEEFLAQYGFVGISPEELSFPEQVQLFSQATHVVGSVGSAMHNVVFSLLEEKLKVLFFCPPSCKQEQLWGNYYLIEQAYGRQFCFLNGTYAPFDDKFNVKKNWSLQLDKLEQGLTQWLAM